MDYLWGKVSHFRQLLTFDSHREKRTRREITRFEGYLEVVYRILTWQDAKLTLTSFLVLNFIFWLVVQLQLRFFGVFFMLALAGFVGDSYLEKNNLPALTDTHLDDFKNNIMDIVLSLKKLRRDSPSTFCVTSSFFFLSISFIARTLSGYVIFYLAMLTVFFGPLALSMLPPEYRDSVKRFIRSVGSDTGISEEDLIPCISEKDYSTMDQESVLTDRTTDSLTSSLFGGITMPSHLDVVDRDDDLLERMSTGVSFTPGDQSSDSDSDFRGIKFRSGHFNGDSSSEEERFTRDLDLGKGSTVATSAPEVSGLINVAANFLLKAAITSTTAAPQRKDSSSDSEFEMINSDEALDR